MTSIRASLSSMISLATLFVVAFFCIGAFLFLRDARIERFESSIEADLRAVANGVKVWTNGDTYVELASRLLPGFSAQGRRFYIVHDSSGNRVIDRSLSLTSTNRYLAANAGATADKVTWLDGVGPNGRPATIATQFFLAQWDWDLNDPSIQVSTEVRDTMVQITVAYNRSGLDRSIRNLALTGLFVTLATSAAAGVVAWYGVRWKLRPLSDLAAKASEIDEATKTEPFDVNVPMELKPIAAGLNTLLGRLSDVSLTERRFTADAAHELRTPIAELRTLTDVALTFPNDPQRLENVLRTASDLAIRLSSLVDALLGIARRETVQSDLRSEPVEMTALIEKLIDDNRQVITTRGLEVNFSGPDTHVVHTDGALLTSILDNLIGNAMAYAPSQSTIRVVYSGGTNGFRLDVSNLAPNLTHADMDKIFEPFWRKDGSTADRCHSGLGLTLAKNFANILGFALSANLLKSGELQLTFASG